MPGDGAGEQRQQRLLILQNEPNLSWRTKGGGPSESQSQSQLRSLSPIVGP
jgi:hypothetical protein